MESRFREMKKLLDTGKFFKLVCGAGNENLVQVSRLSTVYTLAGANGLDVSASSEVVESCVKGIKFAYQIAPEIGVEIQHRPFITVSVGMPGDHHVRKARIDKERCVKCELCLSVCPVDAISEDLIIDSSRCIGCGHCENICSADINAIYYQHNEKALENVLPRCLEAGAENIELHAAVPGDDIILSEWKTINKIQSNHFVSICLDRLHLSDSTLIFRIKKAMRVSQERTIIQADGVPMSGGRDDFNTTLQAIAIADVINKNMLKNDSEYQPPYILLSGGTNGKTGELAKLCDVRFNGVSIGTHARKIVKPFIQNNEFELNIDLIKQAVTVAGELVTRNIDI